jgi:hypothetical protein
MKLSRSKGWKFSNNSSASKKKKKKKNDCFSAATQNAVTQRKECLNDNILTQDLAKLSSSPTQEVAPVKRSNSLSSYSYSSILKSKKSNSKQKSDKGLSRSANTSTAIIVPPEKHVEVGCCGLTLDRLSTDLLQQEPSTRPLALGHVTTGVKQSPKLMVDSTRDGKSELKRLKEVKVQMKDSLKAARVQKEMDDKQTQAILALKKQQSLDSAKVESLRKELNEKDTKIQDDRVDTLQTQLHKLQEQVARLHKDLDLVHMEKLDVIVLLDKLIRATESKNGMDHIKMKEALVLVNDGERSLVGTESSLTDNSNDEGWFCRPCT